MRSGARGLDAGGAPALDALASHPGRSVFRRRLSSLSLVVYALGLAVGLGLGSAYWAVRGGYPFGGIQVGPWLTWPRVDWREIDPYARAVIARSGDVPLALGEGLAFHAAVDDTGLPLDASCTYEVGSATPQARAWTLTAYQGGRPIVTGLGRSGFTSAEILRRDNGEFTITLSREARPGNWLQLPASARFNLILRLYDTPLAAGSVALDRKALPRIVRGECVQ